MDSLLNTPRLPMEPVLDYHVHDSGDFIYQVKWDGVRILSHIAPDQVRMWNKRRHERTAQYPEFQALSSYFPNNSAILDGEAVVLIDGKPSFPGIMSRDRGGPAAGTSARQAAIKVDYMIFDLLYANGKDLTGLPLTERKNLLHDIIRPSGPFHLVEDFEQGSLLFEAVQSMNLEGIVAKKKNSLYQAGKRHRDWFKYKNRQSCQAVVGGYMLSGQRLKSLLLGLFRNNQLFYIGRAGSGLSDQARTDLSLELPKMRINDSPFINLPIAPRDVLFVHPLLVCLVEFAEWSENLHLRSPVVMGFSARPAEECRFIQ